MVEMTASALKEITKELKQYSTPSLNDKMYLHFKGWKKIEACIGEYTGCRALWLEGNGLHSLEHLQKLTELRCLYVQQNLLSSLEGLEHNLVLDALNACNNSISAISHLEHLKELHTLQLAHNRLETAADLEHLAKCPSISVLDLQNNRIDDVGVLEVLAAMPELHVLQLQGNPVTRKIQHYRKTIIARCAKLTYLDDRPVFEDERRTVTAWARGGVRGGRRKAEEGEGEDKQEEEGQKAGEGKGEAEEEEEEAVGAEAEAAVSGEEIRAAMAEGRFDTGAAHRAEKAERVRMRRDKEEAERRNREAFEQMLQDARTKRMAQILPYCRLLKGLPAHVIDELALHTASNPLHTNKICGFAKEDVVVHAGEVLAGLYVILKGKMGFVKAASGGALADYTLSTGQFFGELSLAASKDQVATADVVARDYSEVFVLRREELLRVPRAHPAALPLLQANRSAALRCQWHECKPWAPYELTFPRQANRSAAEDKGKGGGELPEGPRPAVPAGREQEGRGAAPGTVGGEEEADADAFVSELSEMQSQSLRSAPARQPRSAPESASSTLLARDAFRGLPSVVTWGQGLRAGAGKGKSPAEWYGRHEVARSVYVAGDSDNEEGGGEGVAGVEVDRMYEEQWRRVQAAREQALAEAAGQGEEEGSKGAAGGDQEEEEEDVPELEDVDVEAIEVQLTGDGGLWGEDEGEGGAGRAGPALAEEGGSFGPTIVRAVTEYERDNAGTEGGYNRELEAKGEYDGARGVVVEEKTGVEDPIRVLAAETEREEEAEEEAGPDGGEDGFVAAAAFGGRREGFVFKRGDHGLGYYRDAIQGGDSAEEEGEGEEAAGYQDGDMDALD